MPDKASSGRYRLEGGFANFTAVPNEVLRSLELSGNAKALYAILIDVAYLDEEPTQQQLGKLLGGGAKTARSALTELHDAGLLEAFRPGLGRSNYYMLMLPQGASPEPQKRPEGPSGASAREQPSVLSKTVKDKSARARPEGTRPRDPIWDAFVLVFGASPAGSVERNRWNAAAKDLREIGASGEEVVAAAAAYRVHSTFRDCVLTPHAIVANWTLLTATAKSAEQLQGERVRAQIAADPNERVRA